MKKVSFTWDVISESELSDTEKSWNHYVLSYLMFCSAITPIGRDNYETQNKFSDYSFVLNKYAIPNLPLLEDKTISTIIDKLRGNNIYELTNEEKLLVFKTFNNYTVKDFSTRQTIYNIAFLITSFFVLICCCLWVVLLSTGPFSIVFSKMCYPSLLSIIAFLLCGFPMLARIKKQRNPRYYINCFFKPKEFISIMDAELPKITSNKLEDNIYYQQIIAICPQFQDIFLTLINAGYVKYSNPYLLRNDNFKSVWFNELCHDERVTKVQYKFMMKPLNSLFNENINKLPHYDVGTLKTEYYHFLESLRLSPKENT